jgi:predicted phosphoribosyltransferase
MFRNREDAGLQLARELKGRQLREPLVLAIPRGGVVVGAVLAGELGADLDVVLSQKLRAPHQPELAIGAISESGDVYLNEYAEDALAFNEDFLGEERRRRLAEIAWRTQVFRSVRPRAEIAGRSVIVTDDGIATGSTMIAALHSIQTQSPHEVIVAVPLSPPEPLEDIRQWCTEVVCLLEAPHFLAVAQFYEDFPAVEDEQAVALLRKYGSPTARAQGQVRPACDFQPYRP